jgi:hypothetical protein
MKTAVVHKPLKPLNPRSADTNAMGMEPAWDFQPTTNRISALSKAFSWYNYFYGKKDARDMIVNYLERHDRKTDVKLLKGVSDSSIRTTTGWLCRMSMMGLELTDHEQLQLDNLLKEILESNQEAVVEKIEELVPRVTIQDRLREKLSEAASELDAMFDDMIINGAKMSADYKPIVLLRGLNVAPQLVSELVVNWKKQLEELEELQKGKDAQLVEGYSNFNKVQVRNLIKFIEQVISDCASYVQIKKVERKPRKVKPVSPEKVVAKFKYCKEFAELKLKSEPVTKLVGAQEAWLYDTKKRKLIYVVADSHIGSFTVKGSGLIGFDTVLSVQKTLRKPADQIKALLTGGVAQHRKYFKDIKATDVSFNGRGNENLVLLKVR